MLTWAVQAGLIAQNPVANLVPLPQRESTKVYRRRALSEAEITRFLEAARADDCECAKRVAAALTIESGSKGAQPARASGYVVASLRRDRRALRRADSHRLARHRLRTAGAGAARGEHEVRA